MGCCELGYFDHAGVRWLARAQQLGAQLRRGACKHVVDLGGHFGVILENCDLRRELVDDVTDVPPLCGRAQGECGE